MIAPQSVMDAQDNLMNLLITISNGKREYVWSEVRELSITLINSIREDIGIDKSPIVYRGQL